jgi:hypothetical protein
MDALYQMINRFRFLSAKVIWLEVFRKPALKKWIIEELIQKDQLTDQGIDEDGDIIGLYSEWTEMINPSKEAGTPYNLNDSGEFYRSMYIRIGSDYFEVDADPIKIDENGEQTNLFNKYGIGIIGLTQESKEKLSNRLIEEYQSIIERSLLNY